MFARITASIKTVATTVGILFLVLAALPQDATASEGGTSHYIQGAYGDFLMATFRPRVSTCETTPCISPPGWMVPSRAAGPTPN